MKNKTVKLNEVRDADEAMDFFVSALLSIAGRSDPQAFKGFLGGMLGNVVGRMPDDYWEKFIKLEPCGIEGCNCHTTVQPPMCKGFEVLREDHRQYMEARKKAAKQ